MTYFAKIDNGIVQQVIVADLDFINSGASGDPSSWIECSIDGLFRRTYPGIGYHYDVEDDLFYPPSPYPSWQLDENYDWVPPVPVPNEPIPGEGQIYTWNEENQEWDLISLF